MDTEKLRTITRAFSQVIWGVEQSLSTIRIDYWERLLSRP
jgi:hypothetical protein